ncbi:MAG: hypothetical protein A7316_01985 [Candidatus Altiarchaeales archaeon WOR_SM1_86-2]|nr:MAG: hypothetical protein A7316_01985 [Candidatus Altiarchaeales archaeon WOR_SM1_86-2]
MKENRGIKKLEQGESENVEFKKSTAQMERALKSICAFLNHLGGGVYFGIHKGKVIGQEVSDQTLKSISQRIRQRIKPEISPQIKVLESEGKKIIEVGVKEGMNKPYYLDGVAHKRVGTENVVIPPEEIERIILEKRKKNWESEICEEVSLEDVDEKKVRWFVREARIHRGLKIPETLPVKDILMKLKLSKDEELTNACALLFSKEPKFLQSEVKCIRFSGNEPVKPYIDFQTLEGDAFALIDQAEDFVCPQEHKKGHLVGSGPGSERGKI